MAYRLAFHRPRPSQARLKTLALGLLAALLTTAPSAVAQDAPPVNVRFTFSDPLVSGLYPTAAELATAEHALSSVLAGLVEKSVTYWPGNAAAETAYPQLRLRLQRDGTRWFVMVELLPVAGQPATYTEQVEVYGAGEISTMGGFPPRNRIPDRIEKKLTAFYSNAATSEALRVKLGEGAPLGGVAHLTSAQPRVAILPLKWDRYCSLALSTFALEYVQTDGSRVVVIGEGLGERASFTPEMPRFEGVKIQPKRWKSGGSDDEFASHLADLSTLTPRFFRLMHLTTDLSACVDVAGAPLSVAP